MNIKDLKYFIHLEELTLNVKNVKNLSILKYLDKLDRLVLINGNMKTLKYIEKLNISTLVLKNFTLSSLESLSEIDSLARLEISDTFIGDISILKDLSDLSYLSLTNVSSDTQASLCVNGNYKEIYLSETGINLDSLSHCTNLVSLGLENINQVKDMKLPDSLRKVAFKNCGLTNLNMFLSLPNLASLDVSCNLIQDINDLTVLNYLEELSLAYNPIHDLNPIQCLKDVTTLNLSGIRLDKKILDLISKMRLEALSVSNCDISDLNFLERQYKIKNLDLSNNRIDNIEMLKIYRHDLKTLNISENPIRDLSPLKEWAPNALIFRYYPLNEGVELDVSGINLGEIECEKGIEVIKSMALCKLTVRNCGLTNTDLAAAQLKLQFLDISDNPIEDFGNLCGLPFLKTMIARGTLISEKELPYLSILLNTPGTYGIPSLWKMPGIDVFFPIDASKKEWVRLIIK